MNPKNTKKNNHAIKKEQKKFMKAILKQKYTKEGKKQKRTETK